MPRVTRWPTTSCSRAAKERYLRFLQDAHDRDWNYAIHTYYGLDDVASLERHWSEWVTQGSPELEMPRGQMVAQADTHGRQPVIRSQSPDAPSDPGDCRRRHQPRRSSVPPHGGARGSGPSIAGRSASAASRRPSRHLPPRTTP